MHEKHKHFNSNSTIGVKKPIAENSKINRKPNAEGNTQTINDLVDDTEPPSKHNESFANQKLSREIKYIGRNIEEPTNIGYNKEKLYLKKIEDYTPLDESILCLKIHSSSEPKYVIPLNFDISDEVYNPYAPVNINSSIHYSEETNEFREQDKFLSIDCLN